MTKIEIPLSATKIFFHIIGSALFVAAGFYLFFHISETKTGTQALLMTAAGIASILFFGATGIYSIRKLMSKRVG